jgi:hypothetical protein
VVDADHQGDGPRQRPQPGFNTSYVGGDGKPLFSASHPTANGTQSNLLTAADLSEAALEDAVTNITNAKQQRRPAGSVEAGSPDHQRATCSTRPASSSRTSASAAEQRHQRDQDAWRHSGGRGQQLPRRHRRLVHPDERAERG